MDERFWNQERKRWDGHTAFNTVNHEHVSCYSPADGHDSCDITVVECADGRWYVEDTWGRDAKGVERVWNPHDRYADEPYFFENQASAFGHAVAVVARVCGVPESEISGA